jgi:hypothetical protein
LAWSVAALCLVGIALTLAYLYYYDPAWWMIGS